MTPDRFQLQRVLGTTERAVRFAMKPLAGMGFPLRAPTTPRGVIVPDQPDTLGAAYDTEWARRPVATISRSLIVNGPLRLAVGVLTRPRVSGLDRLSALENGDDTMPVVFAANHESHLDTAILIHAIPRCWRRELVVAAAADYFFDRRWKAASASLALNAVPIDRHQTGRRSAETFRGLLDDGYSILIYPEGGRSPDGWAQEFRGGAAYLAQRAGAPIIPIYLEGSGAIWGKGARRFVPGRTQVVFGEPIMPDADMSSRKVAARLGSDVARLADEATSSWWEATQRFARGSTPSLSGPETTSWRRSWALHERRRRTKSGRPRPRPEWPHLS